MSAPGLEGSCDERFQSVADVLAAQLTDGTHHGVSFAAYFRGELVVDVWGGRRQTPDGEAPWRKDTMTVCWSTTKGIAATALHMAMERHGVSYDAPVSSVWPEFGKEKITIRHILCHEAGLAQIRGIVEAKEITDWDHMVHVMEDLEPLWEPGTQNGYHAITFGWLVGETLRRIDGRDVPTFLAEEIAGPLSLDGLYIGLPEAELPRVAPLIHPDIGFSLDNDAMLDQFVPTDTVGSKALAPRGGLFGVLNSPAGYRSCIPSISGVFTARSVAKVYAALERGGEMDGVRLLSDRALETATAVQSFRPDLVITSRDVGWRLGYMSGGAEHIPVLGPHPDAFGHVGAGGTFGFADPRAEIACGLVYDLWGPLEFLGGPRSVDVAHAAVNAALHAQNNLHQ